MRQIPALGWAVVAVLVTGAAVYLWQRDGGADPAPPLAQAQGAASAAALPSAVASEASASAAAAQGPAVELPEGNPAAALRTLKSCYFANRCNLASPEGLEEHFAVSRAVVERLRQLPADPALRAEMAREFIGFPDGHVQAAALALAAALPSSADTVAAVVAALRESSDAVLLEKAYPVLRDWQSRGLNNGFDEMFLGLVSTGGWNAAQSVAENVLPFLHEGNVERFRAAAEKLQPGARQEALRRAVRDFELQRRGG